MLQGTLLQSSFSLKKIFSNMSLTFSKIEETELTQKLDHINGGTLVHGTVDRNTINEISLPNDYIFSKCCVTSRYEKFANRIHNFKVRTDDIWLVGHFKSGTTWMHNIIWQLKNNLNFSAKPISYSYLSFERPVYPVWDHQPVHSENEKYEEFDTIFDQFDDLSSPRLFKSHLPAHLLPKELWTVRPKIIYTARNPKDIVVSHYHFMKNFKDMENTKDDFFDAFLIDYSLFGPLHDHVLSFWQLRKLDHVLFTVYEDLLANQFNGVKRVSEFLECSYDDDQLRNLTEFVSFKKLKSNVPTIKFDGSDKVFYDQSFYRKGKAGTYRDEMSEEYIRKFDEWTTEKLRNSDFQFAKATTPVYLMEVVDKNLRQVCSRRLGRMMLKITMHV